jgi:hypothetical protein
MVVYAYNPSNLEAETRESLVLRSFKTSVGNFSRPHLKKKGIKN